MSASLDTKSSPLVSSSSPTNTSRRGIIIVILAVIIWSTTPIFIDQLEIVYRFTPVQVSGWRAFLVTLGLALSFLIHPPRILKLTRGEIGYYALYGVVGVSLFGITLGMSVAINRSAVANTLIFCAPVFVALGSWWFFHEKLKALQMGAIAVNLAGCALVGGIFQPTTIMGVNAGGIGIGLFCGVCLAVYTLLGRRAASADRLSSRVILFYTFLFGTLALLVWGLFTEGVSILLLPFDWSAWMLLLSLSLGPTLFGYLLFNVSLRYLSAATASIFHTLEPAMTALFALLLLRQTMNVFQWCGLSLIIGSVVAMQAATLKKNDSHKNG